MAVTERCLLINLGAGDYAVPLRQLLSIEPMARVVPVPRVPSWILGVTYREGRVLPVVDLGVMLSDGVEPDLEHTVARLLIAVDGDVAVALAVPAATEVFTVSAEHIAPVPPLPDRTVNRYLTGNVTYGEQSFGMLDLGRLMRSPEFLLIGSREQGCMEQPPRPTSLKDPGNTP